AAMGTCITSFILIPKLGFEDSVYLGAGLNFLCAILSLIIYVKVKNEVSEEEVSTQSIIETSSSLPIRFWIIQYALSGFMAISFEIIWFRMIDLMMKSYAVTFSIILTIYLGVMAIGTYAGVWMMSKIKMDKLKLFLYIQLGLYAYTVLSLCLFHWLVPNVSVLEYLMNFFHGYDTVPSKRIMISTMVLIPLFFMAVPTFIMGFSFTLSQNIIQNRFEVVGRNVGWLQFSNIVGSTLGAWFATLIGFQYLGSSLTIKLVCLIGLVYAFLLVSKKFLSLIQGSILGVSLLVFIYLIPFNEKFWMNLNGVRESKNFVFQEDETAFSSIKIGKEETVVFINGLGQSHFPIEKDYIHIMLGAIPTLIHPNPKDVGIIGLGSGCTLYSAAGRAESQNIDCFEVIVNQPSVVREYADRSGDKAIVKVLDDKRVTLRLEDGRNALFRNDKKYDVLEADALRPRSSFSGNLYSVEYFSLLKSKLKPGGITISWVPTERIRNGFRNVFPYVYQLKDDLYVGSESKLDFDGMKVKQRLNQPFALEHFKHANIDIFPIMDNILSTLKVIQEGKVAQTTNYNSDMWPKDEYQLR
ncbi:MAG: spermine synthase, partial [Leadbetterella sp.]